MGRRCLAIGLAIALQAGALTAPLVHAHLDHHEDRHVAARVHAHLDGHTHGQATDSGAPSVHGEDASDRIIRVSWFVASYSAAYVEPALPQTPFAIVHAIESVTRQRPDIVRSHGPPARRPSAPRAPPLFLS